MKENARIATIALVALGVGYTIGTHHQPVATASPLVGLTNSTYITSGSDGRELVVWKMDGPKAVTATRYLCDGEVARIFPDGWKPDGK